MHLAANWPDVLEIDFRIIYIDQYKTLPAMVPDMFNVLTSDKAFEKSSSVGQVPDHQEFTGKVGEVERNQGYDKVITFTEYTAKIMIQHKLASDDQNRVVNRFPEGLATSANRSREKLGANVFILGFTYEPSDGDGTELFASDHPSNVSGVAPQSNESTLTLGATNVETTRLAMMDFYGDIGEKISVNPDTLIVPMALEETGYEIINSKGKVDTADNNVNFHQGKYKLIVWPILTDAENWWMSDYAEMKKYLLWWNREPIQMFQDKDSNTLVASYVSYYRCGTSWDSWHWGYGNTPS